jgi:hypothetical protein
MNLDKTSDPYCILRFVDQNNLPVSRTSVAGFWTKHVLKTLSPVWNQQLVFHSDSGFLRATYAHIEVWDRDVVTANTCMGEVFVPLKRLSPTQTRMTLPLEWSPLMPTEYRKSSNPCRSCLFHCLPHSPCLACSSPFPLPGLRNSELWDPGVRCACDAGGGRDRVSALQVLEILHPKLPEWHDRDDCLRLPVGSCSASPLDLTLLSASASASNWLAQPGDILKSKRPEQEMLSCCLKRHLPGMLLFPLASLSNESQMRSRSVPPFCSDFLQQHQSSEGSWRLSREALSFALWIQEEEEEILHRDPTRELAL